MSLRAGERKELQFGEQKIDGIEGIELLEKWKEEERRRKRAEKGLPSDAEDDEEEDEDEAAWNAWNVEDDDDSDDSGGWISVESDGEIELTDSDDENQEENSGPLAKKVKQDGGDEGKENNADDEATEKPKSNFATTHILTPADLAKLSELRVQASINAALPGAKSRRAQTTTAPSSNHAEDPLTAEQIEGLNALSGGKPTREDKIAHARQGKTDRSERKSATAKRKDRKEAEGKSTTNKEKARKKNFFMTLGKGRSKKKRSLTETRKVLKAHTDRQRRGGRRGNGS